MISIQREKILLYALLTSLTAISIDALLPGLRVIEAQMAPSPPLSTQYIITLFVFGMAFGELVFGPLSDAIGRKKVLLFGLAVYSVGTVVAMCAGSIEVLVLGRILQGVGVSGPKIATRAMIRDQFEGDAMARMMSIMFALFILAPMVAPALGQGVITVVGWRGVFTFYLVMAALLALWVVKRQPETLTFERRIPILPRLIVQNGRQILAKRRVSLLIVSTGLIFGAQLVYLSTSADLFFDVYGIDKTLPIYLAVLAAAIGLASCFNASFVLRVGMNTMTRFALVWLAVSGLLMLGSAAVWDGRPPLTVFIVLGFIGFFVIGILFGNLNAMAMRPLAQVAGLGASLIAAGSSLVATVFSLGLGALYDGTVLYLGIALSTAGIGSLILSEISLHSDQSVVDAIK